MVHEYVTGNLGVELARRLRKIDPNVFVRIAIGGNGLAQELVDEAVRIVQNTDAGTFRDKFHDVFRDKDGGTIEIVSVGSRKVGN